jgi:hypothetical protein
MDQGTLYVELSDVWLFACPCAGDIENMHLVELQETFGPVRGVGLTGVKVEARFVMLPGELDRLPRASAQDRICREQNCGIAVAHVPFGPLEVGA